MIGSYERALNLGLDPARFSTPFNGTSLAVSHWKLRLDTYGWVSIQPSQPKQAILRTLIAVTLNWYFSTFSLPGEDDAWKHRNL